MNFIFRPGDARGDEQLGGKAAALAALHEPKGRASSLLRADDCNHAFLPGKGRRAPVLRSTNAKRGHQPSATAEGGRSDAPYLGQSVHGPDARPMLEIEALQDCGCVLIPEWFVVLPSAFESSVSEADRHALSGEEHPMEHQRLLARINLAPAVMGELRKALADLSPAGELVAVRSSAREEDDPNHSFAGQLESFLSVHPDDVAAKVTAVWRSAFGSNVGAYRERHQLPRAAHPPAVLIQRMIRAETAGVAFGADPISGLTDFAVVSAVRGLGTALVNGESKADTWHVDASGKIVQRQIAHQPAVLDDAEVRAVAGLVRRTGEHFGRPQDIEWAIVRGSLYLLQSRPITSSPNGGKLYCRGGDGPSPATSGSGDGPSPLRLSHCRNAQSITARSINIWDNSNIIESYSGVTTPLTFSFARRAYEGVYRRFCQILAVPKSKIMAHDQTFRHMLGLIRGRVYYNLLNWYRVLALLPGFTLNRRFMEQMMGVKEELPAEILAELRVATVGARLKDGFDVLFSVVALVTNHFLLPHKTRRFQARLNEAVALPDRPLAAMTADELAVYFLGLEQKLLTRWDAPLLNDFFAMVFYGTLRRLTTRWAPDAAENLHNDLLCGEGGMISAEPARKIRELAELASKDFRFVKLLCEGRLPEILADMDGVPKFTSAYREYLARFGDRCLEELKLESLTLHEDPLPLLRSVGGLARLSFRDTGAIRSEVDSAERQGGFKKGAGTASSLYGFSKTLLAGTRPSRPSDVGFFESTLGKRQSAEARVKNALAGHPLRRVLFRWVLRQARARVRDRENLRFERTRLFGLVRRLFVELGRRLYAEGHLLEARDIFFLEIDELLRYLAGSATTTKLKALVVLRQAEFAEYRAGEPPPGRFTTRGIVIQGRPLSGVESVLRNSQGDQRKGIGCSPGFVRGRVRKIADPRNAVIDGREILVTEHTDPGWVLLFPSAAGLLVERGSLLSHSAIVARELGLPTIVAIDGLTSWLNDGDEIEFDGSTGRVWRLAKAMTISTGHAPVSQPTQRTPLSLDRSDRRSTWLRRECQRSPAKPEA